MFKFKMALLSAMAFVMFASASAMAQDPNAPLTANDLTIVKKFFAMSYSAALSGSPVDPAGVTKFAADNNISPERLVIVQTRVSAVLMGSEAQLPEPYKPSDADVALINGDKEALTAAMTTGKAD